MAANIRIDQTGGAGAGTAGNARDDLRVNVPIDLVDVGAGGGPWQWTVVKPRGSSASLVNATTVNASINPDLPGTYSATLTKNGGAAAEDVMTRVFRVTKTANGEPYPGLLCLPAPGEVAEHSTGISGQGPLPPAGAGRGHSPLIDDLAERINALEVGGTDAEVFWPTGVAADDTDRFEAALNAGKKLVGYGTLKLDRRLVVTASGWEVIRSPELPFAIVQDPTWSETGASSLTNSFVQLAEVEAATAATTPSSAKTPMHSPSVAVTSGTGFAAGGYFKTLGVSAANDYFEQSAGANCPAEELLQCDSVSGGTTIVHRLPQTRHIGQNNATVPYKTIKLLTSAVDGGAFRGVKFDAYQSAALAGTNPVVACAVSATFARRITFEDCSFKGFTYAAVYARGCRDWVGNVKNLGATNRRFLFFSCQNMRWHSDDVLEVYERANTRGSANPRFYAWQFQSQCHNIQLSGTIQHVKAAVLAWGGDHCKIRARASDVRFEDIGEHATGIPEDTGGRRGYILDTNANDVPTAEFGRYNDYEVEWSDAHSGTAKYFDGGSDIPQHWFAACYLHDVWQGHWKLRNSDLGRDPATSTAYRWLGVVSQDVSGTLDVRLKGFVKGGAFIGTQNSLQVTRFWHHSGAGDGSTGYSLTGNEAGIILDEGSGGLPYFVDVRHEGYHLVEFYSSFAFPLSGYRRVLIEECRTHGLLYDSGNLQARDIVIARAANSSAYPGPMLALPIDDGGGTVDSERRILVAPAAAPADGVLITMTINTNNSGVLRPVIGVLGGPTAVAPIYIAAGTTIKTREFVECQANGYAIPAVNGANDLATLMRIIGRGRYKRINAGGAAIMQLG